MFIKVLSAALLCGVVLADIRVYDLKKEVDELKKEMYAMSTEKMLAATHDVISINAAGKLANIDTLRRDNAAVKSLIPDLDDKLSGLFDSTEKGFKGFQGGVNTEMGRIKELLKAQVAANTAKLSDLTKATSKFALFEGELNKVTKANKELEAKINKDVGDKVKKATDSIDDKQSNTRHVFSAGPRKTHQAGGWHDFDMDRVEYDTLAPYAKQEGDRRIRILKKGLFHWKFIYMGHSGWCHRHGQFYIDGNNIMNDYHNWSHHWHHSAWEVTWMFKANQQAWGRVYACNHAWHGTGSGTDAYDRVQIEYVGQIDPTACKSSTNNCGGL